MSNYLDDNDYGWFYRKGTNHDIPVSPATRKLILKGFKSKSAEVEENRSVNGIYWDNRH